MDSVEGICVKVVIWENFLDVGVKFMVLISVVVNMVIVVGIDFDVLCVVMGDLGGICGVCYKVYWGC